MAGVGAQTFTFQLSTKTAEKTGGNVEQYRLQLTPSVNVPFTAQPRCQLEQLAFTNTVTNVDAALYGNNTIVFKWNPFVTEAIESGLPGYAGTRNAKTYTMTVPDGTYSLPDLEEYIARELYEKTNTRGTISGDNPHIISASGLFHDMNLLAGAQPYAAGGESFACAKAATGGDYSIELKTIPGQHLIGGTLFDTAVRLIWVSTVSYEHAVEGAAKCRAYFSVKIGGAGFAVDAPVVLKAPSTLTALDDAVDCLGFGGLGVAYPSLSPDSGWGTAISMEELTMIAHTDGAAANTVAPDRAHATTATDGSVIEAHQNQRKIKPVTLVPDPVTHKIRAVTAMPLFKIDESSTLFSKLLGFDSYDSQNMLQLPPAPGATRQNLSPWIADKNSQLARTRAIEFHCPTLINSSYDQHGRCNGGCLASLPVTQPRGGIEVWQASYDNSLPISYHGGSIDSLTWSLCDQDGLPVNLQGSDFNATIRISWDDPVPPQIGSAGAEAEDAYGMRDIKYVS